MQNYKSDSVACTDRFLRVTTRRGRLLSLFVAMLLFTMLSVGLPNQALSQNSVTTKLRLVRTSPLDLEFVGDLANLPPHSTRYLTREDLLLLPLVNFTATDGGNFAAPTQMTGVPLDENYSRAYIDAYHPVLVLKTVLVLKINGQPLSNWPKDAEGQNLDMGPYISHTSFTPIFKILSHNDEPQIPWGVLRIEFADEAAIFGAIAPPGPKARDPQVQGGYRIAQQNCFHCHDMGDAGGQKAGRPFVLSGWATASPDFFAGYVHNPKDKDPHPSMPAFPGYDAATLRALVAYFQTFITREKP